MLFADTGLSDAEITLLFVIWSTVGLVGEVPSGALADRFSRRGALAAGGVLQAAGYVCWVVLPGFPGFAAGFVLWGIGGALASGAMEALLYDGLAAVEAEDHYARINGWVTAIELIAQVPTALAATWLFASGGYQLVGWVSVGCCLASSALVLRLPEPPREAAGAGVSYVATLRAGIAEAATHPPVRSALIAVGLLGGLDAFEEYFTLMAQDWAVPTALVPVAVLGVPLAGAAGAALGGTPGRRTLALLLALAAVALAAAGLLRQPVGLVLVGVFYALYQYVLVAVDSELQHRIEGSARATVTSVSALGVELAAFAVYAAWVLGQVVLVAALTLLLAALLSRLLAVNSVAR